MGKKAKPEQDVAGIAKEVVALLEPLTSENRQRVVTASLTLLGENPATASAGGGRAAAEGDAAKGDHSAEGFPTKAGNWMKQNGLTRAQIDQVFDVGTDDVTVIASQLPGKKNGEKALNAYLLQGVSRLLASGESGFTDEGARTVCESLGCYDSTNHSKYLNKKGNIFAGSKSAGWKLTAPGLKRAAEVIREIAKEE